MKNRALFLIITLIMSIVLSISHLLNFNNASWIIPFLSYSLLAIPVVVLSINYILKIKNLSNVEMNHVSRHISLFNAVPESLVVISKKSKKCCFANNSFYKMTGLKSTEILGHKINSFLNIESNTKDDNIEQVLKIETGDKINVILSWDFFDIDDCSYEIIHISDISTISYLQENIKFSDTKKLIAFHKAKAAIVIIDANSKKIIQINESACKILDKDEENLIGQRCQGLICNLSEEECRESLKRSNPFQKEETLLINNSKKIILRGSAVVKIEQSTYIIDTLIDITNRKQIENKIQRKETLESLESLTLGIAHEFNNINNIIDSVIGTLLTANEKEQEFPDHIRDQLNIIKNMTKRESEIVDSLSFFGKPVKSTNQIININETIQQAIQIIERSKKIDNVDFNIKIPLTLEINFDFNDFITVFKNIILNSIQSMVGKKEKEIEIVAEKLEDYIVIKVKDSGDGIESNQLEKIFNPFFTTKGVFAKSGTAHSEIKGVGLGLSICQIIIERHNKGSIDIESAVGKGTTVCISIPILKS